jgi:hypothetical protein
MQPEASYARPKNEGLEKLGRLGRIFDLRTATKMGTRINTD